MSDINKETLQIKLAKLERELLRLKTSAKVAPSFSTYFGSISIDSRLKEFTITYADGPQPIITDFYGGWEGVVVPWTPSGNTQRVYTYGFKGRTMGIVSTRPILSIG